MTSKKKWKQFEELVTQVQKSLSPHADVRPDQKIRGRITKRNRQIDIAIYSQVGQIQLLSIIECKDYQKKVNVETIEEFKSKLSDIGANKGIVVSPKGFTTSAKNVAKDAGIELYRLADTRDHDWKRDITVPFYIKMIGLKEAAAVIQDLSGVWLSIKGDIELLNEKGEFVSYLQEELWDAWNSPKTNTDQPNVSLPLITDKQLYIRVDGSLVSVKIFAKLSIEYNVYFKEIPIHMSGFENVIEGGMHFPRLETAPFELNDVQENWENLGDVNYKELTQKGFCALGMTLKNSITEEDFRRVLPNKGVHRTR